MPSIITSIHDPIALAAICRQSQLPAPTEGWAQIDDREVFGWVIHLPGVLHPIVCDTLTGLVAYDQADNGLARYGRIMRFVYSYYQIRNRQRPNSHFRKLRRSAFRRPRRLVAAG